MNPIRSAWTAVTAFLTRQSPRLVAFAATLLLYAFAELPRLSDDERRQLAGRFVFETSTIDVGPWSEPRNLRETPVTGAGGLARHLRVSQLVPSWRARATRWLYTGKSLPEGWAPEAWVRAVNPTLDRLSAWISSVGAGVALADLDGDGLANDVCLVDPRFDSVVVAPVPGSGARYEAFPLSTSAPTSIVAPMGCVPADVDEDGRLDLVTYYWGRPPRAFLRGPGELGPSAFRSTAIVSGAADREWYTNALTTADVNGDGHLDLIVGNYFDEGARILDPDATTPSQMPRSLSSALNGGRNRVLLWTPKSNHEGAGFEFRAGDCSLPEATVNSWTLAVGAADLDGDLLPELYFANDFGPDVLLHNRSAGGRCAFVPLIGRKGLTTARSKVLGKDSFKGMGVDFGDVNGDGRPDIYVSNIADEYALEESHFLFVSTDSTDAMWHGRAPYRDASEDLGVSRSGWGWDSKLADFDNDGILELVQATGFVKGNVDRWPELQELAMGNDELLHHPRSWPHVAPGDDLSGANPNAFFTRARDGRYYDLAASLGIAEPWVTRGIATADVDGDGDLDMVFANQWEPSIFLRNESPRHGGFLALRLLLPAWPEGGGDVTTRSGALAVPGTRPAVGATAVVHVDGLPVMTQVDGGNGHSGVRSHDLHLGLGDRTGPVRVDLSWRDASGEKQSHTLELRPGWHTVILGQAL